MGLSPVRIEVIQVAPGQLLSRGTMSRGNYLLPDPSRVLKKIEIYERVLSDVRYPTLCGFEPEISSGPKSARSGSGCFR
jgi:hypothetical protein